MIKPAIVEELVERLEARHGRQGRVSNFDPMEELVSCILSQHTADVNSFPAFDRLRAHFPDWGDMVRAGPEGIVPIIQNAGLANQKSRTIVACLKEIHRRTGAYSLEVLRDMPTKEARDWLTSLKGVGLKTASIVLCFAFGRETIPVDTHVFRVAKRIGLIGEKDDADRAHDALLAIVPMDMAYRFHVALVNHGRAICRAPIPKCHDCPVTDLCRFYRDLPAHS